MNALSIYRPRVIENALGTALSEFDRYMDSFFGGNFLAPPDRGFTGSISSRRLPAVDVRETEKTYILEAELPGFNEKDIEIRLNSKHLTIESKKAEEKKDENTSPDGSYLVQERRCSSFSRSFKLPDNADPEGITASFTNGVLSLEINKKAEAVQKLIPISAN